MASFILVPEYHAYSRENHMQAETTKKLFTVAEYYQMAEAGILGPGDPEEIHKGHDIFPISPLRVRALAPVKTVISCAR